jgi:hypothetical protein
MRRSSLGAFSLAALLLAGCRTVTPFAGKTAAGGVLEYAGGQASQAFPRPEPEVRQAVVASMAEQDVHAIHQSKSDGTLYLDGTAPDGRHARITIRPDGGQAVVMARIGRFGDEMLSRALLDGVGRRLGAPAAGEEEKPRTPLFSRDAVPDALMLREHAESGYRDTPTP